MKNSEKIQTIKKNHPFKLWDLSVYVLIAVAVALLLVAASAPQGDSARITYFDAEGKQVTVTKQLGEDFVFEPPLSDGGHYKIVISGGRVWTEESDCKDKVCMTMRKISRVNQQIICIPHRITITITGKGADAAV